MSEVNISELKLVSDAQLAIFLTFFEDKEEVYIYALHLVPGNRGIFHAVMKKGHSIRLQREQFIGLNNTSHGFETQIQSNEKSDEYACKSLTKRGVFVNKTDCFSILVFL